MRKSLFFKDGASGGYTVSNSCIYNGSNEYMDRTPSSASNRKTFTWSCFVKRDTTGADMALFAGRIGSTTATRIRFNSSDNLFVEIDLGATIYSQTTTATYTSTSNWYHVLWRVDTTAPTAADRSIIEVDGSVASLSSPTYPPQNSDTDVNNNTPHFVGCWNTSAWFLDGKLSECHFIDGQSLDSSNFASGGSPIEYTGSYSTNGFFLDSKNSSNLGEDAAGSNDYTTNNMDATNQSTDVPS